METWHLGECLDDDVAHLLALWRALKVLACKKPWTFVWLLFCTSWEQCPTVSFSVSGALVQWLRRHNITTKGAPEKLEHKHFNLIIFWRSRHLYHNTPNRQAFNFKRPLACPGFHKWLLTQTPIACFIVSSICCYSLHLWLCFMLCGDRSSRL